MNFLSVGFKAWEVASPESRLPPIAWRAKREGAGGGHGNALVYHQRPGFLPKLFVSGPHGLDHLGVLGCNVSLLGRILLHVVKTVLHKTKTLVADRKTLPHMIRRLGSCLPTSPLREKIAVFPLGLGILEKRNEASTFDLAFG